MLMILMDLGDIKPYMYIQVNAALQERKKGFGIMLIALMDVSCLKILHSFKEREEH